MKRYTVIDKLRGITIISMVLFHLIYNINFYHKISWYDQSLVNKIWQLSIATSFFILSGITANILSPYKNIIRGIKLSLIGFLISLITYLFAPEQLIIFGVLNGLGASMIIAGILQKYLNIHSKYSIIFLILFILSYNLPDGKLLWFNLTDKIYKFNLFFLGFPSKNFYSNDFFSIIPWTFIYISGFLFGKYLFKKNVLRLNSSQSFINLIGRYSLEIYLIHQVILYPLVSLILK